MLKYFVPHLVTGGVVEVAKAAIRIASSTAIGVGLGGVVGVVKAAVRVTSSIVIKVFSSTAIRVAGSTVIRVASGRNIANLFKIKLSQSCKATVIISLILIRARPISSSIYL